MDANDPGVLPSSGVERAIPETGPYVLRALLEDLPLSADGDRDDIEITCVEFLGTQFENQPHDPPSAPSSQWRIPSISTANPLQIQTFTLARLPPKSCISSKYLRIPQMRRGSRHIY
jgi:hypothetical protein